MNCYKFLLIGLLTILALTFYKTFESAENTTPIYLPIVNNTSESGLLPKYDEAKNFVDNSLPSDLLKSQNFIISSRQLEIPSVSRSSKTKYYDIRDPPVIVKDDSLVFFNNPTNDIPLGSGRLRLN
jgi:hypothetical protein